MNAEIFNEWNQTVKCVVFTRDNYRSLLQKVGIEKEPIVYTLASLKELPCQTEIDKPGISSKILMSRKFYIGQSKEGLQRITQHCVSKDPAYWWEIGVAFFSKNFSLDILRTLENVLTQKAEKNLPSYSLVSDPKNTYMGRQTFPVEEAMEFIGRILGWLGIDLSSEEDADREEARTPLSPSSEILFTNPDKNAWLSLNLSIKKIKLLKGSHRAKPDDKHKSLSDSKRQLLRKLNRDANDCLLEDYEVDSPSGAGALVTGRSTDGNKYWVSVVDGRPLGEIGKK